MVRCLHMFFPDGPAGHVDDYAGALPYLHCGGEKGKPEKTDRWQEGLLRAERSMLFPKN